MKAQQPASGFTIASWIITLLFLCRVLGQAGVYFLDIEWLPPLNHWYSGLLAYQYLLPAQILILLLMLKINRDVTWHNGYFNNPGRKAITTIRWFSCIYAASMLMRYAVTMYLYPERRWLGEGTIPVTFHLLLALYLFLYSCHINRAQNTSAR